MPRQWTGGSAVVLTSFERYVALMEREGVTCDARFRL